MSNVEVKTCCFFLLRHWTFLVGYWTLFSRSSAGHSDLVEQILPAGVLVQDSQQSEPAAIADSSAREGLLRVSVAQFLVALVLVLVAMPFVEYFADGDLIETVLMTLVLLAAVPAIGGQRRTFLLAMLLVTPAVAIIWLDHLRPGQLPRPVAMAAAIFFVAFVAGHLLRFILQAPQVTGEVLCAGVAVYLMLAILWAFAYLLVELLVPNSFVFTVGPTGQRTLTGFEAVYFSFGTMTTVGYGDIIPISRQARMVAMLEATSGLFYVTMLIARLVALYSSSKAIAPVAPPAESPPYPKETAP